MTSIGSGSFAHCKNLATVHIGESVNSISERAFDDCNLSDVYVYFSTPFTISWNVFSYSCKYYDAEEGEWHNGYPSVLHVPYDTKSVYQNAIYWNQFGSIVEMEQVSPNIEFADSNVKALCVANWDTNGDGELSEAEAATVTDLGTVFNGASNITSFKELKFFTGLSKIGTSAFYNCSRLSSIEIPNTVTIIGDEAFEGCSSLLDVVIPSSVTSLYWYAFRDCTSLTSIVIPNSVTSMGLQAFYRCSSLENVTISNSITKIDESTFKGCTSLKSVTIPQSVTYISSDAFADCSNLASISVESGNTKYDSRDNCNAIIETESNTLLFGCKNTIIPNTVAKIKGVCYGITSVIVPSSVAEVSYGAYPNLTKLTLDSNTLASKSYDANGSLMNLSYYFGNNLNELIFGNTVTSIGYQAFSSCSGLVSVTIPNTVTSIGEKAFSDCFNLKHVYVYWEVPLVVSTTVFKGTDLSDVTLHVPYGTKSLYQLAEVWKDFGTIVETDLWEPPQAQGAELQLATNIDDAIKYYLYNEEAGAFFTEDNDFGTRASYSTAISDALQVCFIKYVEKDGDEWDGKTIVIKNFSKAMGAWKELFINSEQAAYVDHASQYDWWWEMEKDGDEYHFFGAGINPNYNPTNYPGCYFGIDASASTTVIYPCLNIKLPNTGGPYYVNWKLIPAEGTDSATMVALVEQNLCYSNALKLFAAFQKASHSEYAAELQTDIEKAKAVYDNTSSTSEELAAAEQEILLALNCASVKGATEDNPKDATGFIKNNDFSAGNIDGWACTFKSNENATNIGYQNNQQYTNGDIVISGFIEAWANSSYNPNYQSTRSLGDAKLSQLMPGLPAGKYKFTCDAIANCQDDASRAVTGVELFATGGDLEAKQSIHTGNGIPEHFELVFINPGGDVELGLRTLDTDANWIAADNFTLTYYGTKSLYQVADVYANPVSAVQGQQVTLPIYLNNEKDVCNFQFDLQLPEGLTIAEKGSRTMTYDITLGSARFDGLDHSVSSALQEDGSVRVLVSSTQNTNIWNEDESGRDIRKDEPIVNVTLDVASDMDAGSYEVLIKNIILTSFVDGNTEVADSYDCMAEITVLSEYSISAVSSDNQQGTVTITSDSYNAETGTAHADETVTVTATPSTGFVFWKWQEDGCDISYDNPYSFSLTCDRSLVAQFVMLGDVLEDGQVNVGDLTEIAGYILRSETPEGRTMLAADVYTDGIINVGDFTSIAGIILNGYSSGIKSRAAKRGVREVVNLQFDMEMPLGVDLSEEQIASALRQTSLGMNHGIMANRLADGKIRVVVISSDNSAISNANEVLANMAIPSDRYQGLYQMNLSNVVFAFSDYTVESIGSMSSTITFGVPTDINGLNLNPNSKQQIFDLNGHKLDNVGNGINIVDGKKFFIK